MQHRVSASEFDLLTMTRGIVDGNGASIAWMLKQQRTMPKALSPQAHEILQELLSKGVVMRLCRWGGWRHAQSLCGQEVVSGRLWQRHNEFSLHFSEFTIRLLVSMAGSQLGLGAVLKLGLSPKTLGDELIAVLALDAAREANCFQELAALSELRGSALCWLTHLDVLAIHGSIPDKVGFEQTLEGTGSIVQEAMSEELTSRWLATERGKSQCTSLSEMLAIGGCQDQLLRRFLPLAKAKGREDLAFFVLRAAVRLADDKLSANEYSKNLEQHTQMRDRSEAMTAAAALLNNIETIYKWVHNARSLRFFDDGFDAGQLILKEWEALGDLRYGELQSLAAEISSFTGLGAQ